MAKKTEQENQDEAILKALDASVADLEKSMKKDDEDAKGRRDDDEDEDAKGHREDEDTSEDAKGKDEDEDAKGAKDEDEDAKGKDEDEDAKGKDEDEDAKGKYEDEDAKGKDEDEDAKGDDEDEEEDDKKRKGHEKSVEETLAKSEKVSKTIEISPFLREFVKSMSEVIGAQSYQIAELRKSVRLTQKALVKSVTAQNEFLKSMAGDMTKSLEEPLPRKGHATKIEKSFRGQHKGNELSKAQISDKLSELEIAGKVPHGTTSRFEAAGVLDKSCADLVYEGGEGQEN